MSFLDEIQCESARTKLKHVETRVTRLIPADQSLDDKLHPVPRTEERLFIGSMDAAHNLSELEQHKISHILVCAPDIEHKYPELFTYEQVDLLDDVNQELSQKMKQCIQWIEEVLNEKKENRILVHCVAGVSRSASVCLCYMMYKNRELNLEAALTLLKKSRKQVQPNKGFMSQMEVFHQSNFVWLTNSESARP
jgi:dual specificity phosphatase 12